jgi:7-cyano-7-deazaguanine synthase
VGAGESTVAIRRPSTITNAAHDATYTDIRWLDSNIGIVLKEFSVSDKIGIVLLSGGLDSATVLAIANSRGFACHAVSFRYGQRHQQEITSAAQVAARQGAVEHLVVDIDLGQLGGSALTANIDVPKHASADDLSEGIPVTYVPARNTIFLSYGLAVAETRGASHLFIGVNSVDYSGYPDCRPEYLAAFQAMANLATKQAVEEKHGVIIDAPLITLSKAEIIKAGNELGVDYSLTISCYDPGGDGVSCGHCDACLLRRQGFTDNGLVDPIPYQGQ